MFERGQGGGRVRKGPITTAASAVPQWRCSRKGVDALRQLEFQLDSDYPRPFDPLNPHNVAKRGWPSVPEEASSHRRAFEKPWQGTGVGQRVCIVETLGQDQGRRVSICAVGGWPESN